MLAEAGGRPAAGALSAGSLMAKSPRVFPRGVLSFRTSQISRIDIHTSTIKSASPSINRSPHAATACNRLHRIQDPGGYDNAGILSSASYTLEASGTPRASAYFSATRNIWDAKKGQFSR